MFIFNVDYLQTKQLNKLDGNDIRYVLSTLSFLSSHSWEEILVGRVKKYHAVPLTSIKDKIANHHTKSKAKESGIGDKSLVSFAYKSAGRILGFRKNNTFFITYIDTNHDYC